MAIALSLALAWLAPANALAYSALVRWQPSTSGSIAEYEVYKRISTGSYGASEPGTPSSGGGILSLVASNLDVRTDYVFRVKAVATSGTSPLSNEVRIGYLDVAAFVDSDGDGLKDGQEDVNLNRLVDAGESDPTRADSDGDGVGDPADMCEGTAAGAAVSSIGCSCAQVTCGDGNACNGTETCSAGVCRAGTALVCNDGNACTTDGCNPSTGCTTTPIAGCGGACTTSSQCNDNNPCTTNTCSNGMCTFPAIANGTACGDGNACNGAETCQAGTCAAGTPLTCNDGNSCTTDSCDAASGCKTAPIAGCASCTTASQCNDNNPCTTNACSNGMCAYTAIGNGTACGDGNACNGAETCQGGSCAAGTPLVCNDGNACTTDSCSPSSGCTTTPITGCGPCTSATECKDGNPCTSNLCTNGMCQFVPFADGSACSDNDACTTNDRCASARCVGGGSTTCPAPGPCAVGRCDAALGCVSDPVPDGTGCDDGNVCTTNDTCSAGVCGAGTSTAASMTVQRFAARSIGDTEQRLRGRATLPGGAALELDRAGMTLEIEDASGAQLYGVDLPGSAFLPQALANGARLSIRPGADPKLRRLAVSTRGEDVAVRFTIVGEGLLPPGSNAITLKVRPPKGCGRTTALACTTGRTGVTCAAPEETILRDRRPSGDEDAVAERIDAIDDDPLRDTGERRSR